MGHDDTAKRLRRLLRAAQRQGWEVTRTGSRHFRFRPPDPAHPCVIVGFSPSSSGLRDAEAMLRRSGFKLP